jgi:DNA-binding NtrC family response regulator
VTTQGANILLVDDEEIVLVALRETLRQQGYNVVAAQDALQGLSLLQRQRFAAVLSDQQMPVLTGLEFLTQVKSIQPDATRILITAVLNLGTVIDAINKAEIFRFVLKPWQREELLSTVQKAVERYEDFQRQKQLLAEALARNEELLRLNGARSRAGERRDCAPGP